MHFVFLSRDTWCQRPDTRRFDWDIASRVRWRHFVECCFDCIVDIEQGVDRVDWELHEWKSDESFPKQLEGDRWDMSIDGGAKDWDTRHRRCDHIPHRSEIEKEAYTTNISIQHRWNSPADIHNHRKHFVEIWQATCFQQRDLSSFGVWRRKRNLSFSLQSTWEERGNLFSSF